MTKTRGFAARSNAISARRKARKFALQALYQIQLTKASAAVVELEFIEEHNMQKADKDYFHELLSGIEKKREILDENIAGCIDRKIEELDPIELSILRMGIFELMTRIDIPFKVVINEHIELARSFGATDSYKYVNSILDKLSRVLRAEETGK